MDFQDLPGTPQQVTLCFTVQNVGSEGPVGSSTFDVGVFFSTDQSLDENDVQWAAMYSAWTYHLTATFSERACFTKAVSGDPRNNRSITPGTYYLIVKADAFPGQAPNRYPGVQESNENNNVAVARAPLVVR